MSPLPLFARSLPIALALAALLITAQALGAGPAAEPAPSPPGLLDQILSAKFLLSSAIVALVINVVWTLTSGALSYVWLYLQVRRAPLEIAFAPCPAMPDYLKAIKCQIVRYGTDSYISKMASDREKFDGRLRNRVLDCESKKLKDGALRVRFRIPLHRRLGTQFRVFCQVDDLAHMDEALRFLSGCDAVAEAAQATSFDRCRIYLLLDTYSIVETADEIRNNHYYPV